MSDERKSEVEGQLRREPDKEVEGQARRDPDKEVEGQQTGTIRRLTDDAQVSEDEKKGDATGSGAPSEVEGQMGRRDN